MPNTTTNFGFNKPLVNDATDEDLWGGYLNDNFDDIDAMLPLYAASKYGALVVQSTSDTGFEILSSQGTSGYVLQSNGADALPSWAAAAEGIAIASAATTLTGTNTSEAISPGGFAGNKSLAANGYYKLPGGLIIQWGYYSGGANGPTITFPTAFSTACYAVVGNIYLTTGFSDTLTISAVSTTTFTGKQVNHSNSTTTNNFYWVAIGK